MADKTIKIDQKTYDRILSIKKKKFWTIKHIVDVAIKIIEVEMEKEKEVV